MPLARTLILLASLVLALAPPVQAGPATPVRNADANLLLFEVRLGDQLLSDAMTAYQVGDDVYLPFGEMAHLLTLAISVTPEAGQASGYILTEGRGFSLDVARRDVVMAGQHSSIDPTQIKLQADEIYVASRLLARWLPADFDIDMPSLLIRVRPREQLPLQARQARSERGRQWRWPGTYVDPGYPRLASPYALADLPFIDQTASFSVDKSRQRRVAQSDTTSYLTADLLGMEAALYASYNRQEANTGVRLTLGRNDPDAGLLGPLEARSALVGSVPVPGAANISINSATGNGVALSNRPLDQPTRFDTHSLQGDLPPGWDVELYYNDALIGLQQSRVDGRYSFDDLPLAYGPNEFRLVFHGPLGQLRVERQSFLLEQSAVPGGQLYYDVAAHRDQDGHARAAAQFDWGLSDHLSASAGLLRLPVLGQEQSYATFGLRSYLQSFILDASLAQQGKDNGIGRDAGRDKPGRMAQLGLRTRIGNTSLSASHIRLDGFSSEWFQPVSDPVRTRDELRADAVLPGALGMVVPLSLQLRRDQLVSGTVDLDASGRLSVYSNGLAASNALHWQSLGGRKIADGLLQVSRRVAGIGLNGQLQYMLRPDARLGSLGLTADRYFAGGYAGNLSLVHTFVQHDDRLAMALNKSLGSYGLGVNVFYTNHHEYGAGVQFFMALGLEPRSRRVLTDAQPMANTGGASVRVFLDKNMNGIMDADEAPIQGAGFTVNGGSNLSRTGADGIAYVGRLPAHQHVDLAIDPTTLEDPQWQPRQKGVRVVARQGKVNQIDFAVSTTGEVDGTTYVLAKGAKHTIGALQLELVDGEHKVVASLSSAADGYYVITGIFPGDYLLRIDPAQLARLGLSDNGMHLISIGKDGTILNGRDFYVQAMEEPVAAAPAQALQ
jgi:hypothetical protein